MVDKPLTSTVNINAAGVIIKGNLTIPPKASALVIFAHGSGSSRFSPRNSYVASTLNADGLATLLIDLLSSREEEVDEITKEIRFNIEFLASRLSATTVFCQKDSRLKKLNFGYFGSSTGAAAALKVAADQPKLIKAIVSRGGRPDLAGDSLVRVRAPTLFLVGGEDYGVLELNRQALDDMIQAQTKDLVIIPNATHLFEEPGTLEQVAAHASNWFKKYLPS